MYAPTPADWALAERLSPLLARAFPRWPKGPVVPHPIQGSKSRIFQLQSDVIVKIRRHTPGRKNGFEIENRVLHTLAQRGIACPRSLGTTCLEFDGQWICLAGLSRLPGISLAQTLTDQASSLRAYALLGQYLRDLNQPWDGSVTRLEAEGFRRWTVYYIDQLDQLKFFSSDEMAASQRGLRPIFVGTALEAAAASATLVHNDPQAYNVILDGERLAMIDWESTLLAPASYQLATALTFIAHPGFPLSRAQLEQRQAALGVAPDPLILAFRLQRLLGALQVVYSRRVYLPEAYLQQESQITNREEYERLIRYQCEGELRHLLGSLM